MAPSKLDNVISLAKRRGFVFPSGEIYGGTRSAWDYGPYGVELKENIKRQWWKWMVNGREDVVGLDSSIILPREVWDTWLSPAVDAAAARDLLGLDPPPLAATPVSDAVSSVANDGPHLVDPLPDVPDEAGLDLG